MEQYFLQDTTGRILGNEEVHPIISTYNWMKVMYQEMPI